MKASKVGFSIAGAAVVIVFYALVWPVGTAGAMAAAAPVFGSGCDSISFDQPINVAITNGSIRCYGFEGSAGDIVTIRMTRRSGDSNPFVALVTAGSTLALASGNGSGGSGQSLIAGFGPLQGRRYEILVSALGGLSSGEFELSLSRGATGQVSPQVSSCGGAITSGQSLSGHLTVPGAVCRYTFDATRGDVINVAMRRIAGRLDPFIEIVDSAGNTLVSSMGSDADRSNTWITDYRLRNSGSHTIVARSHQGQGLGPFELNLWKEKGCGGDLRLGQPIYARITDSTASCSYTLDVLTVPTTVTLVIQPLTGDLQSVLQLRGPDGHLVTESDLAIQQRVEQAGTYLVTVSGAKGTSGDFRLLRPGFQIFVTAAPAFGGTMRFGYPITGEVRDPKRVPVEYSLNGSAGDTVTIFMAKDGGSRLDPYVQLLDPDGVMKAYDDDNGGGRNSLIVGYRLEVTGKYTIKAGAYRDDSTGVFYLTVWK